MHTRKYSLKAWLLLICLLYQAESFAQDRIALVIGNSDYQEQPLNNPTNDASDISDALSSLGFDVDLRLNASQEDIEDAVSIFTKRLKKGAVGLFYFSGHGVQHEGSNYLIPIGAMPRISAPDHLRYKAVDVGYVLGAMEQAENSFNIVILDACRNNPFKSFARFKSFAHSMQKGLKRMPGIEGTIIAYATSPGNVALDGVGSRNSPYTKSLIENLKEPNVPVEIMFKQVRKDVRSETSNQQSPWYEASIDGDFYFNDGQTSQGQIRYSSGDSRKKITGSSSVAVPEPDNYAEMRSKAEKLILAYKNNDINLDDLEMRTVSDECSDDEHFVKALRGMVILFSYYYLVRLDFINQPYSEFSYAHTQDLDLKDMLLGMSYAEVIKNLGKYVGELTYQDGEYILHFLRELKVAHEIFVEQISVNKDAVMFLNVKGDIRSNDFYDLGFPKPINRCVMYSQPYFSGIRVKGSYWTTHYNVSKGLVFYLYSFWLRRYNDGTIDIADKVLDFVLWYMGDRIDN